MIGLKRYCLCIYLFSGRTDKGLEFVSWRGKKYEFSIKGVQGLVRGFRSKDAQGLGIKRGGKVVKGR